jgi:Uma2 family endonuclease
VIVKLPFPATFDDLMKVEGKAELIGGRIVELMPTGDIPNTVAFEIAVSLRQHARDIGRGRVHTDNMGFAMPQPLTSGRESFSPDASFTLDPPQPAMGFIVGAPTLAVEVRSENDYGRTADREYAEKRADYFEAGTLVVWDVDPDAKTVTKYEASAPTTGVVFRPGDIADAEPAVPGWRLDVTALFA